MKWEQVLRRSAIYGFGLAMFLGAASTASAVSVGDQLSDLKISHNDKGELNAATLKGKVTIVNFWATWCAACKVELKEMVHEFAELKKNDKIQFAFVSLDKDPKDSVKWLEENIKNDPLLRANLYVDPKFVTAEQLNVDSFPMTLVIDQNGKVVHIQRGFEEGKGTTTEIAKIAMKLVTASTH